MQWNLSSSKNFYVVFEYLSCCRCQQQGRDVSASRNRKIPVHTKSLDMFSSFYFNSCEKSFSFFYSVEMNHFDSILIFLFFWCKCICCVHLCKFYQLENVPNVFGGEKATHSNCVIYKNVYYCLRMKNCINMTMVFKTAEISEVQIEKSLCVKHLFNSQHW